MKENQTTVCPNCGAAFEITQAACPYCGTIYEAGAERAYMENLEDIREDLGELPNEAQQTYQKELGDHTRRIVVIVIIALAVLLVLAGIGWALLTFGLENGTVDAKEQMLWERENFAKLDALYEQGDYDAIIEYLDEAYETGYSTWNWEHSELVSFYSSYQMCMERRSMLTDAETANLSTTQFVLGDLMYLLYYKQEEHFSAADWEIVKGWRSDLESILYDDLQFSEEEAGELYSKATENDYIDYDVIDAYAKKIWKRCIE